jgi:hypothetical protein
VCVVCVSQAPLGLSTAGARFRFHLAQGCRRAHEGVGLPTKEASDSLCVRSIVCIYLYVYLLCTSMSTLDHTRYSAWIQQLRELRMPSSINTEARLCSPAISFPMTSLKSLNITQTLHTLSDKRARTRTYTHIHNTDTHHVHTHTTSAYMSQLRSPSRDASAGAAPNTADATQCLWDSGILDESLQISLGIRDFGTAVSTPVRKLTEAHPLPHLCTQSRSVLMMDKSGLGTPAFCKCIHRACNCRTHCSECLQFFSQPQHGR